MSFINKAFTFASIFLVAVEASVLAQRQTSCATLLESCADSACCDGFTCASLPILGSVCSIALPTGTSTGSTGSTGSSSTGSTSSTGLPGSICAASGEPCVTLAGDSICCTGLTCSTSLLGILGYLPIVESKFRVTLPSKVPTRYIYIQKVSVEKVNAKVSQLQTFLESHCRVKSSCIERDSPSTSRPYGV
ncbi:uncharacterized protein C8R40DRAFT_1070313 [Lentinula edodes]|uniref:uncharacterized protein n=1 Tax=Lentinula edodes TaxID=5353 RepID=UPI001E8D225B|nr:uncharacterized protein C8R40DRAFT_1070313 [Lentinula edodes]KAH7874160.1 hypothetical protein C8R40DRAFT_1070313 [Lentinula edodes]